MAGKYRPVILVFNVSHGNGRAPLGMRFDLLDCE